MSSNASFWWVDHFFKSKLYDEDEEVISMSDDERTQEDGESEAPAEDGSEPGEKQLGTDDLQDQFGTGRDALGGDPKAGTENADDPDARTGAVASEDDEPEDAPAQQD